MLTDTAVRNAKGSEKPRKLADEKGLYLLVTAAGKYWRYNYRYLGKRKTLALGVYPTTTLSDARQQRDKARKLLADGDDPGQIKQEQKRAAKVSQASSFEAVAREWHQQKSESWARVTANKCMMHFESHLFGKLGAKPVSDIKAPEVLAVLRDVAKSGTPYTATRLRELCGQVFRYAIVTSRTSHNPAADLKGALASPGVKHRPALTERKGFAPFLQALKDFGRAEPVTLLATRFALLTFVRSQELRHAKWEEIDFEAKEWKVPARRMKAGKSLQAHTVPLSEQALDTLRCLQKLTGRGLYLFPGSRGADSVMSENTIGYLLVKMGYKDRQTLHGFRASARSLLSERGWSVSALERQLDHAERNKVVAAYARSEHLDERRALMEDWGDLVASLEVGATGFPRQAG